jgi:hypothetical protein
VRGRRNPQITMLASIDLEERVPIAHPLRTIKRLADEALAALSSTFDAMYAEDGRPSIPPERLLKASLLIAVLEAGWGLRRRVGAVGGRQRRDRDGERRALPDLAPHADLAADPPD